MTIQTVFLDMGGTIDTFWFSPEMRLLATPGLQQLLSSAGINLHLTDEQLYELVTSGLDHYHQWRLQTLEELPPSKVWCQYILAEYPEDFCRLDSIAEDLMVWIETRYYQREMRPEIPLVLDAIQKMGYKIGLISNVNSRGQVPLNLSEYGISSYFNPIVLSSEYGRRKPDPSIFHYAARLANTPTSECIYIGDRISRDILGAKRAGFKLAIQIQHDFDHGEKDVGATPDLIVDNMTELLGVLCAEYRRSELESNTAMSPKKVIRAVLFDAEGVLYYGKNQDQELIPFIKEFGVDGKEIPAEKIQYYRHLASIGQITFEQYKQAVLQLYGINDPILISRGIQIYKEESNDVQYFTGIVETLNALKNRNLYLGIVTDTAQPLYIKINKLERGGIGNLWDSIISSREVGVQKPDPKIYQLALQQLGITSDQAVFVGHKTIELEGARKVGMKTVAFNYENGAKADFYIEKLSDLMKLPIMS
jgi:putative hydrolase of the HAD superfamily